MIKQEQQLALHQCPQCGRWFIESAAKESEVCALCLEGYTPPEVEEGRVLADVIDYKSK